MYRSVEDLVREQILEELPQIMDVRERERRIDEEVTALSNVELLRRISDSLEQWEKP